MNALRSFIALTLLLCAVAPLASAKKAQKKSERKASRASESSVYISITNEGTDFLGIFFVGNETERLYPPAPPDGGITVAPKADSEVLIGMIRPGEHVQQGTHFDHAFVVRTADMAFRAKIIVNPGEVARTPRASMIRRDSPPGSTRRRIGRCDMVTRGEDGERSASLSACANARRPSAALPPPPLPANERGVT